MIERLGQQLTGQDLTTLRALLGPDPVIYKFASDAPTTAERLLASTSKARLLGTHAYSKVPTSLASDLSADFHSGGDAIPEQVQKDMTPSEGAGEKRANETAAAWLNQVLQPQKDQPLALLVFWPTETLLPGERALRRAVFVVVKAQVINNTYVIQQVTFGDPLETSR